MRIRVVGDTDSARVLRVYLAKAGITVSERLPKFALHCTIHLSEHPGQHIIVDSVDSPLELHILRHITENTADDVILRRRTGIVSAENEIHLSVPANDPESAHAVEVGVLRGVQRAHFHRPWWRKLLPLMMLALVPAAHAAPPRHSLFAITEGGTIHITMPPGGLFPQFQTGGSSGGCAGATAPAHTFCGNNTGSVAVPTYSAITSADLPGTITSNTSGNAATSTNFAATPSLCTPGQAAIGILASGNATGCFTPGGLANPMTTLGDIIYGAASGTPTRLGANSTATNQFLRSISSGVPVWAQVDYASVSGTPVLPATKAAVASNWLNSYTSSSGLFTATQPTIADIATGTSAAAYNFTGLIQCKNIEGVLCVDAANSGGWAGTDFGGWVNSAYAALPSTGGTIMVSAGTYSYSTPIVFGTNGKAVYLWCLTPSAIFGGTLGATVLNFTPTSGSAVTVSTGSGGGMEACQIKGPASGTGIGLNLNFAVKQVYKDIDVSNFGVNLQINTSSNQAYLDNFYNIQLHDAVTNNLLLPTGNAGTESVGFFGGIIHQNSSGFSATCVDIGTGADVQFYNISFDQCGMTIRGTNPKVYICGSHFEDPVGTTATAFITFDTSAAAANVTSTGTKWVEDFNSGRTALVQANGSAGGNFTSEGDLVHSVVNPLTTFVALGATSVTATIIGFQSDGATLTNYCTGGTACSVSLPTIGSLTISGTTISTYGAGAYNFGVPPTPTVAGAVDIGTTAKPWLNLWLGTAATNNFKFQPAATSGARIITIADPLSPTTVALPLTIGSGTAAMTTAAVAGGACGTTVTVAATGVLTTDTINVSHSAAVTAANGGLLALNWWPTAGNVNFNYCNGGTVSNTPTAMTVNWRVTR